MMPEKPQIDRVDHRILTALQRSGRMTNQNLAEQVALSPSACLARVRRLERLGVITGYRAQVDPTQLGSCLVIFAELTVSTHDARTIRHLETELRSIPEVVEAYQVSGGYDFLVRFLVADMAEWMALADRLLAENLKIMTLRTIVVTRVLKAWNGVPTEPKQER